jgi:hypothetical protein
MTSSVGRVRESCFARPRRVSRGMSVSVTTRDPPLRIENESDAVGE